MKSTALLAALFVAAACTAAAQDQIQGIDSIVAETQRQIGENHRQLIKNVELKLGDTTLYADEVEVFTDKDLIVARGNVTLAQTTNRISADSAEFNYKTKLGTFHTAAGIATVKPQLQTPTPGSIAVPASLNQETDVYFAGEIVEKIGPRKYKITKGGFTTCVQPTPRWELHADTVIVSVEHYTFLRNAVFNVKGVPLLYTPVMYYPTKKEDRATGILLPTIGQTTLRGESIHNAFFWAIDRSQDATLLHDWFSKTGQGYGSEYRYNYGSQETGYIKAYTLREHSADYTTDTGVVTQPGGTSYQVQGAASQLLPAHIMARGRVDYFSSLQEAQSFNTNYVSTYTNQRSFGGNAVGAWGPYSMNATLDHTEYFSSETASATTGSWPRFTLNRNEKLIPGTPLYFSASGEYASLLRHQQDTANSQSDLNEDVTRLDFNPQIRFPFTHWQWFTVNSTINWRDTHYSRSLIVDPQNTATPTVSDAGLNRTFFTASTQILGPVFNRVWDTPDNGYAEKFKHSIEPFLNITRTSSIDDFNNIIQIDGTDTIVGGTTQFAYGVTNRFYAKRPLGPGLRSQPREIFDVQVQQTYYTNSQAAQYDPRYSTASPNTAAPSDFSPILITVRAMPTNEINAQSSIEIDSRYLALRQVSAGGSYAWTSRITTTLNWSKRAFIPQLVGFNDPTQLSQSFSGQVNAHTKDNKYGGIYSFNYDALLGRMLNQSISGFYNAQCCGLAFQYQTWNYGGITAGLPVAADHRFFLSFTLAGLGNFSPFNGAMSGVTR